MGSFRNFSFTGPRHSARVPGMFDKLKPFSGAAAAVLVDELARGFDAF